MDGCVSCSPVLLGPGGFSDEPCARFKKKKSNKTRGVTSHLVTSLLVKKKERRAEGMRGAHILRVCQLSALGYTSHPGIKDTVKMSALRLASCRKLGKQMFAAESPGVGETEAAPVSPWEAPRIFSLLCYFGLTRIQAGAPLSPRV